MKKALLLEDNPSDANLVSWEIKNRWPDIELTVVSRLKEAKKLMQGSTIFDVAIFDLKLPDGNGMDLLSELRAHNCQTPIIILTGQGSEEIALAALKTGANDYISKKPGFHKQIPDQIEYTIKYTLAHSNHLSVMYVEHNQGDIDLTRHYLKKYAPHIHLTIVTTGEKALELLFKNNGTSCDYDVLLLDYRLVGLNALELTKYIRVESKLSVAIVIVTGQGDEETAVEALKIGADDYIVKHDNYLLRLPSVLSSAYHRCELKRKNEALTLSETKFRVLYNNSPDMYVSVSPDDATILLCNDTLLNNTGYTREEIIGSQIFNLYTDECIDDVKKTFQEFVEKGEVNDKELIIKRKDGSLIDVSLKVDAVRNDKGEILYSISSWRDITDRKRTEKIQKVLYNISNAAIITDNLEQLIGMIQEELGTIIDATNFYIALYDPQTDMFSLPLIVDEMENLSSFPAANKFSNYIIQTQKSLLANKAKVQEMVAAGYVKIFGPASEIWLGVPLKFGGKVTGVLVVQSYTDENAYNESDMKMLEFVSDQISLSIHRKKAQDELREALHKATESDRLKTAFLQNISHEIRTPMNGIFGFTSLLKDPTLTGEEQESYIDIIMISGNRMLSTVNDLMDISMLETGQVKVNISTINVNDELKNLYDFFKPEVEGKGMKFNYSTPLLSKDIAINTDQQKLTGILTNLIKNAIKYSHEGSIDFGYEKKGTHLEFYVKDTGIGIPKDRQVAIFDRFVQADIEEVKVYEGSGLGLSISLAYAEMLGGNIRVESVENEGSQFYFTIPYISDTQELIESENEVSPEELADSVSNLKILIAEDEEVADRFLSIILNDISSEILHAKTGLETLELTKKNPDIDLILMDIKMPIMSGHEVTRKIREFNKDVIIIAQTAYALAGDREKSIDAGCNDYISKPIDKDELMEMIGRLV
ncbi:MAG: response regulator [Bacteroidetes bacterium]|nr:response regulator [Bacteroidota bacterium]MBL6943080.1 response regulator [Bacteroidales bacterium]